MESVADQRMQSLRTSGRVGAEQLLSEWCVSTTQIAASGWNLHEQFQIESFTEQSWDYHENRDLPDQAKHG
jgi:hypothetical protein